MYGISKETADFAEKHNVTMTSKIWIPGSLMSYRDIDSMLECLFLVNEFEGGKGHHDGHMKGRSTEHVLANRMLTLETKHKKILDSLERDKPRLITTNARPQPGSSNLKLATSQLDKVVLPKPGKNVSPRAGVEKGYEMVAATFPDNVFIVGCDLDTSTKLGKARSHLKLDHQFEMSIEEQASALLADGLAMSSDQPQLNIFSTFAAFFEGIAREGFELWRYQRNLNGSNEGLNVTFHLSHVGACTGRDHFSGWGLDWINLAIGYLPHLHRFYAPGDARSAFIAVCDLAAHYGGHIIGIPRDNLPILSKQDNQEPFFNPGDSWEAVSKLRSYEGANHAILAMGAPAFLAVTAADQLQKGKIPTDVYIVNGLPLESSALQLILQKYSGGIVTIEDGIIGSRDTCLRGFASFLACAAPKDSMPFEHIGIVDPRIAPSDGHIEVWDHFGITAEALIAAVRSMV
jgi:transketolase C-terminal domain/subunit